MIPSAPTPARAACISAVACCLATVLLLVSPVGAAQTTSLTLHSEPGDYVGAGLDYSYTTAGGSFNVTRNTRNGVTATFTTVTGQVWRMEFAAPGNAALTPGVWLDAVTLSGGDASRAGLNVTGMGRSCTGVTGSFQVKQVTYGATGNVTAFWALFAQRCDGADAVLSGDLRFRADLPVWVTAPLTQSVVRGQEVFFDIQGGGSSTLPLSLTCNGLPDGATFFDNGNRTGSFDWFTTPDQLGDHRLTFLATNGTATDSAVMIVHVTGLTALKTESDAGDCVGQGQPADLSSDAAAFDLSEAGGAVTVSVHTPGLTDVWSLTFAGPDGAPLEVGAYSNAGPWPAPGPGRPAIFVSRNGNSPPAANGDFEVKELVRDASGIRCFRAVFSQHCDATAPGLRGEIRWNAAVPIDVTAPFQVSVDALQDIFFYVTAADPFFNPLQLAANPLPSGVSFVDFGDNSALFTWKPGYDQAGSHAITFTAVDGNGHSGTFTTRIEVAHVPAPPAADAGGPYSGETASPVSFDGSKSSSPDGNLVSFAWDFGDGTSGTGVSPQHTYAAAGTFAVRLTVCNVDFCASDSTVAVVAAPPPPPPPPPPAVLAARAFPAPGNNPIRLNSQKPQYTLCLEPVSGSWALTDLDPATLALFAPAGSGDVDHIAPVAVKLTTGSDRDKNGVPDIDVTFSTSDLRRLLSHVTGRTELLFRLEGQIVKTGTVLQASVGLEIYTAPEKLNKLSTESAGPEIRFSLGEPGFVRVTLFDLSGRLVATLLEAPLDAGEHAVRADGTYRNGASPVSGVYFYRIEAPEGDIGGRVILTR